MFNFGDKIIVDGSQHILFNPGNKRGENAETICGKVDGILRHTDKATGKEPECSYCFGKPVSNVA